MVAPSSNTTQAKKSIQWAENVAIHHIEHVLDMTPEAFRKVYYTRKEYTGFKNDCVQTAHAIVANNNNKENSTTSNDDSLCGRGLEKLINKKFKQRRRERIEGARSTVLDEQRDQKAEGVCSPEFLAELYEDVSAPAHQEAHERAMKDHEDILSYIQLPTSSGMSRRNSKPLKANIMSGFRVVKSKGIQMFTTASPMA